MTSISERKNGYSDRFKQYLNELKKYLNEGTNLIVIASLGLAACKPIINNNKDPNLTSTPPAITQTWTPPPPTITPTETTTPTPTEIPQPALSELGLSSEVQKTLESRQGWTFRWDASRGAYLITQKEWDANQNAFKTSTLGEVGYIDREGLLHLHSTSFTAVPGKESAFKAEQTHDEITLDLKNNPIKKPGHRMTRTYPVPDISDDEWNLPPTSTPTPKPDTPALETSQNNAVETQLGPFTLIETDNPLFSKTGILTLTTKDQKDNPITYIYSREQKAFVYLPITSFSQKAFLQTAENELPQNVELGFIPWEILHQTDSPLIGSLIASGYDRPYDQSTKDGLLGYILRFEMGNEWHKNDGKSKIAYLRPAYNPEIKNEFIDDPVRWAAKIDEYGDFQRPFLFTITPDGHRIIFTVKQLLNTDGSRLFLPLAIGEIPDHQLSKFIKDFNSKNGDFPQGNTNTSFYGIIIATEGDALPPIQEPYIYSDTVGAGRDILDSLLARDGNDVGKIDYYDDKTGQWYAYFPIELETFFPALKDEVKVQETNSFKVPLTPYLQNVVLGLGF